MSIIADGIIMGGIGELTGTATPSDVLQGKTFMSDSLDLKVGAIPSKSAAVYTPGMEDIIIPSGFYLTGAQTIKRQNVSATHVKKGISIYDVDGVACKLNNTMRTNEFVKEPDLSKPNYRDVICSCAYVPRTYVQSIPYPLYSDAPSLKDYSDYTVSPDGQYLVITGSFRSQRVSILPDSDEYLYAYHNLYLYKRIDGAYVYLKTLRYDVEQWHALGQTKKYACVIADYYRGNRVRSGNSGFQFTPCGTYLVSLFTKYLDTNPGTQANALQLIMFKIVDDDFLQVTPVVFPNSSSGQGTWQGTWLFTEDEKYFFITNANRTGYLVYEHVGDTYIDSVVTLPLFPTDYAGAVSSITISDSREFLVYGFPLKSDQSPDSNLFIYKKGSENMTFEFLQSFRTHWSTDTLERYHGSIVCLTFSPDNKEFLVGCDSLEHSPFASQAVPVLLYKLDGSVFVLSATYSYKNNAGPSGAPMFIKYSRDATYFIVYWRAFFGGPEESYVSIFGRISAAPWYLRFDMRNRSFFDWWTYALETSGKVKPFAPKLLNDNTLVINADQTSELRIYAMFRYFTKPTSFHPLTATIAFINNYDNYMDTCVAHIVE